MNISLTVEQEKLIQEKLKTGNYESVEQVISQALQLLTEIFRDFSRSDRTVASGRALAGRSRSVP